MIRGPTEAALLLTLLASTAGATPLVVLDPGHGGELPGARTAEGVAEKTIVLGVARHARAALEKAGVRVKMTRAGDQHVPLPARVRVANDVEADAFVSIHANSAPVETRRGCETYILSALASDDVSAAMIHLENDGEEARFTQEELFGGGRGNGDVDFILADLRRAATHKASARLAKSIQEGIGDVAALGPSRGLRQAPFMVLRGARMPAALVEIGYVTHPAQSKALATGWAQKAAGQALARGIVAFLRAH